MTNGHAPALSLTTSAETQFVLIDGVEYEFAPSLLLDLRATHFFQKVLNLIARLRGEPTDEEIEQLHADLPRAVLFCLPGLPAEVEGRLSDELRMRIITAFLVAMGVRPPLTPNGASSSRRPQRSKGSTADAPRTG